MLTLTAVVKCPKMIVSECSCYCVSFCFFLYVAKCVSLKGETALHENTTKKHSRGAKVVSATLAFYVILFPLMLGVTKSKFRLEQALLKCMSL